ncbi:MAG: cell division protein FtsA [Treponema sp.]|nr:cell division protein FtsA [Treponema sp.]
MSRVVAGLDIGTNFIRVVIAKVDADQKPEVIGISKRPSPPEAFRQGGIVNIDDVSRVVREAVTEAEYEAGEEVSEVFTAIGGDRVESRNERGMCGVDTSERNRRLEITESTKQRAIKAARAINVAIDRKIIHIIPQEYVIDGISYRNPIGNIGNRLEVSVHLVSASQDAIATVEECILRSGYFNGGITLKTLAVANCVLNSDEMELGCVLIDLGAGTTDVMVLNKGSPVFTASVPLGQNLVTNDIAIIKNIPFQQAEKIKVESGCCFTELEGLEEEVVVPGVGGKGPELTTKFEIAQIIESRMTEIMKEVIKEVVRNSGLHTLGGGVILTGGGALMNGIIDLTQKLWHTNSVRVGCAGDYGFAKNLSYRDPDFATAMGIVLRNKTAKEPKKGRKPGEDKEKKSIFGKIGSGIKNLF